MKKLLLRGEPLGNIKAIIFDKDGTLVNSEQYLLRLAQIRVQQAINIYKNKEENKSQVKALEELLTKAYGITSKGLNPNLLMAIDSRENNIISTATILSITGETWPRALNIAYQVFASSDYIYSGLEADKPNSCILPGVKITLEKLHKNGIKVGLISNDTNQGIKNFIALNKLENVFKIFWSSENYPRKPHPEALIAYCKKLEIDPYDCALASDSDTDLKMAKKSNVKICLGYSAGWNSPPLLYEHHHLIKHWNELDIQ